MNALFGSRTLALSKSLKELPCEGLMAGAREGFNGVYATYFVGTQQDHYVFKLGHLIAQADGKVRAERLKTLTKILTFQQGNNFALGSLVSMMLVVEKESTDWAA
jgi:sorbitol-specific phosphotransferase system component IIA